MKKTGLSKKITELAKAGIKKPFPKNIEPMLATLVTEPVEAEGWVYEMKWDGFRALAYLNEGKVEFLSRNQKSFNEKFYPLYHALKQWKINAVIDGELVAINEDGMADFSNLQGWRSEDDGQLFYYVFDILWLEGYSLIELPLDKRKEILRQVLPVDIASIRFSETIEEKGAAAF